LKVFKALKAEINFNVKLEKQMIKLAWTKAERTTLVLRQCG
jgi:hypothetical protein